MSTFILILKSRNRILYRFGWLCFVSSAACVVFVLITAQQVLGINAFIKPAKFFVSIWLLCWTMGWFSTLLLQRKRVVIYSWVVVGTMTLEMVIITGQAALGKLSHFNVSSPLDGLLFSLMGMAITVFTVWTAYIGYLFFRTQPADGNGTYLWGIRLGILVFVLFAFEGFLMAARLSHTVGAPDGGPGLPVTNWSTQHGDLRVAHFFGMHSLQLIPLFGYFLARRSGQVIIVASVYFILVSLLLIQALVGRPLLAGLPH